MLSIRMIALKILNRCKNYLQAFLHFKIFKKISFSSEVTKCSIFHDLLGICLIAVCEIDSRMNRKSTVRTLLENNC